MKPAGEVAVRTAVFAEGSGLCMESGHDAAAAILGEGGGVGRRRHRSEPPGSSGPCGPARAVRGSGPAQSSLWVRPVLEPSLRGALRAQTLPHPPRAVEQQERSGEDRLINILLIKKKN